MRHLGAALDQVRKNEYARLRGKDRSVIKGQKYTLLSHRDNLTLEGRRSLHKLLQANHRLNVAYLLKESFGQLWDYRREAWARRFFENCKAALRWQRRRARPARPGTAARPCRPHRFFVSFPNHGGYFQVEDPALRDSLRDALKERREVSFIYDERLKIWSVAP
jgi:hypothetical protein